MRISIRSVAITLAVLVVALARPEFATAKPNQLCGVRVDDPHPSRTTSAQIHTRVESFCKVLSVQSNSVSATTYRYRWYGLEQIGRESAGPRATDKLRVTVAVNCTPGERYRYRTEARGHAVIAGETYTAGVYEENNTEIACKA
ncbi:MAG: hypothetical protein ACT4RN_10315 [Pseudonocardia sp.]